MHLFRKLIENNMNWEVCAEFVLHLYSWCFQKLLLLVGIWLWWFQYNSKQQYNPKPKMSTIASSSTWKALAQHQKAMQNVHMRDLFAQDPKRFDNFSLKFNDILFDFSKNIITQETLGLLLNLANEVNLKGWIERMFTGEK